MADEKRDVDNEKGRTPMEEDPDFYVPTAATWGHLDLIRDWLPLQDDNPSKVTELVLFPAAMYGQLEVLVHALPYGDIGRKESSHRYAGWSLMHFAVEGVHRTIPCENPADEVSSDDRRNIRCAQNPQNEIVQGLPGYKPRNLLEVRWRQLDIILHLANRGVPLTERDGENLTASHLACKPRDVSEKFAEAAMLLDVLALLKAEREAPAPAATPAAPALESPGLSSCNKFPGSTGWLATMQQFVEWLYDRRQQRLGASSTTPPPVAESIRQSQADDATPAPPPQDWVTPLDVLIYCHRHKIVNLCSHHLVLTQNHRPLFMDAIRREDYELIQAILKPFKAGSNPAQELLTQVYEYNFGNLGKWRESPLSFGCRMYLEGNPQILKSLLSPQVAGTRICFITLAELGLRHLPFELFHENLKTLDVRGNNLSELPCAPLEFATTGNSLTGSLGYSAMRSRMSSYSSDSPDRDSLNWNCPELKVINLSSNLFNSLPRDLFHLPSLNKLFASGNNIQSVDMDMWLAPQLEHLDLSNNQISSLPVPATISRPKSSLFLNLVPSPSLQSFRSSHPSFLHSSRQAQMNFDVQSSEELNRSQSGFALTLLDLANNKLWEVPAGLPCLAPMLMTLKLAKNRITDLGCISLYPPLIQNLDVSSNSVAFGIRAQDSRNATLASNCCQSQLTGASPVCYHYNHQRLSHLKFLYLSQNKLEELQLEYKAYPELEHSSCATTSPPAPTFKQLFPRLQGLRISNCLLREVPANIHKQNRLCELSIDGNERILQLPLKIHRLTSLFTFKYNGIGDPIVRELESFKSTADILYYLRARETSACPNTSLRLFIIGHYHKGKTTLLSSLRGKPSDSSFDLRIRRIHEREDGPQHLSEKDKASTVGIELGKWVCKKHRKTLKITFYTWDFAGQEEYYLTHQCFLTNRALYLLVWDVNDEDKGIESLGIWLQNLQAKAPGAQVVIVGTHLDTFPKSEHHQRCQRWKDKLEKYRIGRWQSKGFPQIKSFQFVGCPPKKKAVGIDVLSDIIYDVAVNMDSPKDPGSRMPSSLKIKILEEKIPESYNRLRERIETLALDARTHHKPPVLHRDEFCKRVEDIIPDPEEVKTAVNFLHTTTGVVLYFNIPKLEDYFIIDPQRWFDLCALVISPDNVSKLVRNVGPSLHCGLLSSFRMDEEFKCRGYPHLTSSLVRNFLKLYHIIHQINEDVYLVPSSIRPHPDLDLTAELGSFPGKECHTPFANTPENEDTSLPSLQIGPSFTRQRVQPDLQVRKTGLVYRRMLHLPPIASGFWSKLISLFIQKQDFQQIVKSATPQGQFSLHHGAAQQLITLIGNSTFEWHYWRTGIMLRLEGQLLLRVNSLRSHKFEDPQKQEVFSATQEKVKYFHYRASAGWQFIPSHFTEVIEVIVPNVYLAVRDAVGANPNSPMSAKVLTKALEIIDEVLKSHCEHLAMTGIYTINDLLHVVPCPICFGDSDLRESTRDQVPLRASRRPVPRPTYLPPGFSGSVAHQRIHSGSTPVEPPSSVASPVPNWFAQSERPLATRERALEWEPESCYVFTVDECIKQTFMSDHIECPTHGKLEFQHLTPDLVFSDLADVKLAKTQLSAPIDQIEEPDAGCRGAFGTVVKRQLDLQGGWGDSIDVAVKIFDQCDAGLPDSATELTRNYSDMRYELNKLVSLKHPYIVRFIGVFTNPHCFVLEWAPKKSLETIRKPYAEKRINICPTSLILVLLQVTDALAYLHDDVGIVHNDLKCSNILVFQFPEPDHYCSDGGEAPLTCSHCLCDPNGCGVLVKLADLGICANPAARRNKGFSAIRQFVPEVLNFDASFTEKVDIFSLGSCLYVLMSLRRLPPADLPEAEYKSMLQVGKRPQFYIKDAFYPLLIFQFLEECWQQDYSRRPSAAGLNKTLSSLTGISVQDGKVTGGGKKILMDSYVLHHSYRHSVSTSVCSEGSFTVCAALISPEESSTSLVVMEYQDEEFATGVEMQTLEEFKNMRVTALYMTPDTRHILVGCSDGSLLLIDFQGAKSTFRPAATCSGEHGEINGVHYETSIGLLVVGFAEGKVHVVTCPHGVQSGFDYQSQYCFTLEQGLPLLHAMQCVCLSPPDLEVWCGTESDQLEVWSLSLRPGNPPTLERKVTTVSLSDNDSSPGHKSPPVKLMRLNHELTQMIVVLQKVEASAITFVDVRSLTVIKSIQCDPVASLTTTPTKLVVGTYEGAVCLYEMEKVLCSNERFLADTNPDILRAHFLTVYSLIYLEGSVSREGFTSIFPTFVGRAEKPASQEFLVTIGYGSGYPELVKYLRTSMQPRGTSLNAWLI